MAVSYTHLDVYKRQVQTREQFVVLLRGLGEAEAGVEDDVFTPDARGEDVYKRQAHDQLRRKGTCGEELCGNIVGGNKLIGRYDHDGL